MEVSTVTKSSPKILTLLPLSTDTREDLEEKIEFLIDENRKLSWERDNLTTCCTTMMKMNNKSHKTNRISKRRSRVFEMLHALHLVKCKNTTSSELEVYNEVLNHDFNERYNIPIRIHQKLTKMANNATCESDTKKRKGTSLWYKLNATARPTKISIEHPQTSLCQPVLQESPKNTPPTVAQETLEESLRHMRAAEIFKRIASLHDYGS